MHRDYGNYNRLLEMIVRNSNYMKIPDGLMRLFGKTPALDRMIIPLNSYKELMKIFKWKLEPILDEGCVDRFEYVEDVNQRPRLDAESLMTVCRNVGDKCLLEIGTAQGITTAGMALNALGATIYTVNIPPEEVASGKGGLLITKAFTRDDIGKYYKNKKLLNIKQIFANTANWNPDIGLIDVVFIDGCHDTAFVINDTLKVLPHVKPGGFILWHDANPELKQKYGWIGEVCRGIEWLYAKKHMHSRVYWVRDSWVLIYQVPQ